MAKGDGHVLVIGAGAAGLMAARELLRGGKRVTILEAQTRCGGRIYPLSSVEFGYPAEGGAEFVHGEAPVTRALLREAGLSLSPMGGRRWSVRDGAFAQREAPEAHEARFYQALAELADDLPVAEFLDRHFSGRHYEELRRGIKRMVEGYDAADPARASTLALREEWMGRGLGTQGRIAGGYGGMIRFLATECRRAGAEIRLGAVVTAIDAEKGRAVARCADGSSEAGEAAILTVPLPLLAEIALPPAEREKAVVAAADIGYGNVVKLLLRFRTAWWVRARGKDLADLSFLLSGAPIPTWWTQHPSGYPVLTGWFGGPRTSSVAHLGEAELTETGLASLAEIFGLPLERLAQELAASRAIDWAKEPFARGAYSYATPKTRHVQSLLGRADGGVVVFSGEALYGGRDMGTVEAALASGLAAARTILAAAT